MRTWTAADRMPMHAVTRRSARLVATFLAGGFLAQGTSAPGPAPLEAREADGAAVAAVLPLSFPDSPERPTSALGLPTAPDRMGEMPAPCGPGEGPCPMNSEGASPCAPAPGCTAAASVPAAMQAVDSRWPEACATGPSTPREPGGVVLDLPNPPPRLS